MPNGFSFPWDEENLLVDRDSLVPPEVLIEGTQPDIGRELKPLFDALWQSGGIERSPGYDQSGAWRTDVHR